MMACGVQRPQDRRNHFSVYDVSPVEPEVQPELPPWDNNDWRAFAEKQRNKQLMDIEWRRRQVGARTLRSASHSEEVPRVCVPWGRLSAGSVFASHTNGLRACCRNRLSGM